MLAQGCSKAIVLKLGSTDQPGFWIFPGFRQQEYSVSFAITLNYFEVVSQLVTFET